MDKKLEAVAVVIQRLLDKELFAGQAVTLIDHIYSQNRLTDEERHVCMEGLVLYEEMHGEIDVVTNASNKLLGQSEGM